MYVITGGMIAPPFRGGATACLVRGCAELPRSKGQIKRPYEGRRPEGPAERAESFLLRLKSSGPNPVRAAEELDRLQARLGELGKLDDVRAQVAALCREWGDTSLRGERGQAWLVLVGAFDLKEFAPDTARIARDAGLPAPLRIGACRALPRLGGSEAAPALTSVVLTRTDPQVRAAAAEAIADLGDRSARPALEALLEEELPRGLWTAIGAAVARLR